MSRVGHLPVLRLEDSLLSLVYPPEVYRWCVIGRCVDPLMMRIPGTSRIASEGVRDYGHVGHASAGEESRQRGIEDERMRSILAEFD